MEFEVLGPLRVRRDGHDLPLGGPKQRALLAILLLHANEPVSRDRLVEGLWGEEPPPTAGHTLDSYISRLRKTLGDGRLGRRAPGYVLHVAAGELDLDRFESLVTAGREQLARAEVREGAESLRHALDLWRGQALADVLYEPFASTEAGRLEERRLSALEDRLDAELALGGAAELVAELEGLVREHPFRERLLGQLMLALYRSGRQAEALELLRQARHRLAEELGLEPGAQLRELERRILEHDPALAGPRSPLGLHWARGNGRGRLAVIAAAVVAGGAAIGVMLGIDRSEASRAGQEITGPLSAVDARTGEVEREVAFAGSASALARDTNSLWATDADAGVVSKLDPRSGAVEDRIPVGGHPGEVTFGDGAVWVAATVRGMLNRIDPDSGTITQTIELGGAPAAIAFGMGSLWAAMPNDQTLRRIAPRSGDGTSIDLPSRPSALAVGFGSVWVTSHEAGTIAQVDPIANAVVASVSLGQGPAAVATGAGSVWVANSLDGTVSRLDPRSARVVATVAVGSGPVALTFAGGALWTANEYSRTVSRIDPATNSVMATIRAPGQRPTAVAAATDRVWIATRPSDDQRRGGTLTLLGFAPGSVDPAFNMQWYPPPSFLGLSNDTLVALKRASGAEGLRVVPDLAVTLPTAAEAGTKYTFRLRPGIRYSDGRLLKASDIRRGLERLFRVRSPAAGLYAAIRGAPPCLRTPATCDLSRGVLADDASHVVVLRLTRPDPELLFKLALSYAVPVPPGTPSHDTGMHPIPGTGPYRIVRATTSETRFERNPFFREWSHAAQPSGNPDVIVWRYGLSPAAQVQAVLSGRADYMFQEIPPALLEDIRIRSPRQLLVNPVLGVEFLTVNTRLAPFDRVAVRRALNYAIDRSELVRLYGGPDLAEPTCQVLPPGLSGYERYCPYTREPGSNAAWTAPDLTRARRLVAASGTRGAAVTLGVFDDESHVQRRVVRYVGAVLRKLGYRARVRVLSRSTFTGQQQLRVHLIPTGWWADYPAPASFLAFLLACNAPANGGGYCDPAVDRMMQHASALRATDERRSAALWAEIDRRVVDDAALVPLVTPYAVEFISSRLRNVQAHPAWGLLAAQVWLR